MFFHHLSHLHVATLIQSHSAAGFIASSTELHRTSSSTPLCTHQDVNTPLRFGEGRSSSPLFFPEVTVWLLGSLCCLLGAGGSSNCWLLPVYKPHVVPP